MCILRDWHLLSCWTDAYSKRITYITSKISAKLLGAESWLQDSSSPIAEPWFRGWLEMMKVPHFGPVCPHSMPFLGTQEPSCSQTLLWCSQRLLREALQLFWRWLPDLPCCFCFANILPSKVKWDSMKFQILLANYFYTEQWKQIWTS